MYKINKYETIWIYNSLLTWLLRLIYDELIFKDLDSTDWYKLFLLHDFGKHEEILGVSTGFFKKLFCFWPLFDVCILLESQCCRKPLCVKAFKLIINSWRFVILLWSVFYFIFLSSDSMLYSACYGLQILWVWLFFLNTNNIVFCWKVLVLTYAYISSNFKTNISFCICSFSAWDILFEVSSFWRENIYFEATYILIVHLWNFLGRHCWGKN